MAKSVLRAQVTAKSHTGAHFGKSVRELQVLVYHLHIHPCTSTAVSSFYIVSHKDQAQIFTLQTKFLSFLRFTE